LASVLDIAAFVLDFPPVDEDDRHWVLCHFYCPEDTVFARSKSEGIHYDEWVEQGYITATPGNVIDYDYILDDVQAAAELFDLKEMAYDRWGAANIAQKMQDNMGLVVVTMGQGFVSMSAPMKELERRVKGHLIYHGGQPVLSWMADNVVASLDAAGNIKPDKAKSKEKIDGITALIMAISRTIDGVEQKSVYEERGIVTV
jgi:phage terminase large subunit-like protein